MPHSYWRWVRCGPNHPSPTLFALALQWAGIPIIRGSFTGTDAFFGPGYAANLVPAWLPALDITTIDGSDSPANPSKQARKRAADGGVADRVNFYGGIRADIRRRRIRPRHHVRLAARYGRPNGRRPAHPRSDQPGRHLAHRRAEGRRHPHRQPQLPGAVGLLVLHLPVRANSLSQPGGYTLGRQAGRQAKE